MAPTVYNIIADTETFSNLSITTASIVATPNFTFNKLLFTISDLTSLITALAHSSKWVRS